MRKKKP
ncbi:bacterial regulatory s, tetR family protein, partial [Vibrio parahaemolyticus V-223/04]